MKNTIYKIGDRVVYNSPLGYLGEGIVINVSNKPPIAVEFDTFDKRLWNCNGLVPSGKGYMCMPEFFKLVSKAKVEKIEESEYKSNLEYILSHATSEELDVFCGLTKKDYDEFRKHHLEQTIADVSDKTLKKFMKEIE